MEIHRNDGDLALMSGFRGFECSLQVTEPAPLAGLQGGKYKGQFLTNCPLFVFSNYLKIPWNLKLVTCTGF
jgi:hypothetical protein